MTTRLGPVRGVRVVATSEARPTDLGLRGVALTDADVYARLLGADWEAELERRGYALGHAAERWGVERREWVVDGDVGHLAVEAGRRALDGVGRTPDVVLVATSTPAHVSSCLASRVARELGIDRPAVDVRAGGAGGIHAWIAALGWLGQGARTALVIAAETPSRFLDPTDLNTALLYGDGAAAVLLEREQTEEGLIAALAGNDAYAGRAFTIPGSLPPSIDEDHARFRFQRPDAAYAEALDARWQSLSRDLRREVDAAGGEAATYLPYAVSRPQLESVRAALDVDRERLLSTLPTSGCLGCAGPLVALHRARAEERLLPHALLAVGGGIAWAGLLWGRVPR